VGLILAWLLLAQAGVTTLAAHGVVRAAQDVQVAALSLGDPARPSSQVATLAESLSRLHGALRWLRQTSWWASPLARQGALPRAQAVGVGLTDGVLALEELAELAWWTLLEIESGAPDAWETLPERGAAASVIRSVGQERGRLLSVRERLIRVEEAFARLDGSRLARLCRYAGLGRLVADWGLLAPQIAGETPRTVLLVFQNDDEVRATGGFVSSVAELELQNGALVASTFMDSYAVEAYQAEHPPAPEALAHWMDASILLFRDANWSPDFRESAQVMASLYAMDMGRQVDLVVAVNASLAAELLGALGPVWLEGYDVTVTTANVHEVAATFWAQPLESPGIDAQGAAWGEWLAHRKDIGAALVMGIMDRLGQAGVGDAGALATVLEEAIAQKNLLAWAPLDRTLQADLVRAGLDGAVQATHGDYLMVVESNVGWNKVNRNVTREIIYRLDLAEGEARAELTITFTNASPAGLPCEHEPRYGSSYDDLTEGCYWSYVRALVPLGSELDHVEGLASDVAVTREAGKLAFGGLVLVPAGEARVVRWIYRLPDEVLQLDADGRLRYDLLVQKQPGLRDVSLVVRLAADQVFLDDDSRWAVQPDGTLTARAELTRDEVLSVTLRP
jgi:hypothetical protein